MKILTSILLFIVLNLPVFAQQIAENTTWKGINIKANAFFLGSGSKINLSPQYEFGRSKIAFAVGPTILFHTEYAVANSNFPKLTGLQFSFSYFPLKASKVLTFYLFNELSIQRIKDRWTSQIWNTDLTAYEGIKFSNREYLVQNLVGYGIKFKFAKNSAAISESVADFTTALKRTLPKTIMILSMIPEIFRI